MTELLRLCESNPRIDGADWEPWEGNGPCQDCGNRNPIWYTDNEVWNQVCDPDRGLIICQTCFVIRAHAVGVHPVWKLVPG